MTKNAKDIGLKRMPKSLSVGVQTEQTDKQKINLYVGLEPNVFWKWANCRDVYVLSHRSSSFVIVKPTKLESLEKLVVEF